MFFVNMDKKIYMILKIYTRNEDYMQTKRNITTYLVFCKKVIFRLPKHLI